jgi:glycosyltransferase involved in cell wall biosynthesis
MKVAYVVSRFPKLSETFIVRELDAVHRQGVEIELLGLFPPPAEPVVHPAARPWVERVHRPRVADGLLGLLWWLARRPLRTLSSLFIIARGHGRRPSVLVRALITVPLAAAYARRLRPLGVSHVHAHFANYPALAAWLAWRLTGIPYSFTAHAHDLFKHQAFLARKARDAAFVVPISEYNRRFLAKLAGPKAPMHVVHCGVDPQTFTFRPREIPAQGPVRVLCVAALREYKGHRHLLEAVAGDPELERVELTLVGDGELRAELEQLARRCGIADRVRFLGGRPEHEVRALLDECHAFVLASVVARDGNMEGLPVALMEALACGVPVISTRSSGIPELVRDGETGLLAEPADPSSLRAALRRLLEDPTAARRMSEAGRRLVEAEFDIEKSGRRLSRLFGDGAGDEAPVHGPARA